MERRGDLETGGGVRTEWDAIYAGHREKPPYSSSAHSPPAHGARPSLLLICYALCPVRAHKCFDCLRESCVFSFDIDFLF